jgi:hypothetical protein
MSEEGGSPTRNAPDEETVVDIAQDEATETSQSIANLDNISDTAIVGITFLLAALGTWVTFIFPRLSDSRLIQSAFAGITILTVVAILSSVYYLVDAMAPRRFYGDGVGDRFLDYKWLPWLNDDPVDIERYDRTEIESPSDLREAVEAWVAEYDADTTVDSWAAFQYSRLLNYKLVARHKARNTAYGMAFLRLAVVGLGVLIVIGVLEGLVG